MNEQELIQQLKQLKQLEPNKAILDAVTRRVYKETSVQPSTPLRSLMHAFASVITPIKLATFVALFALFMGYTTLTTNPIDRATKAIHAGITSLAKAETELSLIGEEKYLDKASREIAMLNLNGEPGKYTREECGLLYQKYEQYLYAFKEKTQNAINKNSASREQIQKIYNKIIEYEREAEAKWPKEKNE